MKVRRIKDVQEPTHKKHKSKKKLKKVLTWIKTMLVIALFVTTVVYAALSPVFNINEIVVKGASHYDNQSLIEVSGLNKGENGFRQIFNNPGKFYFLRIGSAERKITEECPYIKNVKVKVIIPSKVSIEVKEREAAAIISMTGSNLLIDRERVLLEINPEMKELDLPVIKGIKLDAYKPGKQIDMQEDLLISAFNVYDTIREMDTRNTDKLLPSVDYVDIGDIYNIRFSLQSRVIVNLGKLEDLNYKMNAVQTIFNKNIKKDERGKLDFSIDGNPVFTPENGG